MKLTVAVVLLVASAGSAAAQVGRPTVAPGVGVAPTVKPNVANAGTLNVRPSVTPEAKAAQLQALKAQLEALKTQKSAVLTTQDALDTQINQLKNKRDKEGGLNDADSARLREFMDRRSKAAEELSKILKQISDTEAAITANLK